ncbi:outer membrane protein assembly factor BamB family protein [Botrimarina hoheduenensis]|uniref:Outer membrane biogenesis protein BamB n=1 Tax=Botrimarina hoheduenensis TaxID=2528000 RepID=A0A5C5WE50_9BACT|nr:PQQ-binding-like beta-propeller repeat protein [Botrimarina hoheduenensis]TWT48880.1 outer membrane biogenesis protein BamB [Botrimarina hoheduenensis]
MAPNSSNSARDLSSAAESDPRSSENGAAAPRRVVFPFVWVALLVALYLAFERSEATSDIKTLAKLASIVLSVVGVAFWYTVRGRAPWVVRAAVGMAPFIAAFSLLSMYQVQLRGDGTIAGLHRRGTPLPDQLLAAVSVQSTEAGLSDWSPGTYDYPRFLGNGPWAEAVGPALAADWKERPADLVWRQPIGAGWSSFAVQGRYAVTQEQRGSQELVVCYDSLTGEPVWSHADDLRYEPEAGQGEMGQVGPRATPTIVGQRVYTQGAAGLVNCLDGRTGQRLWSLDTASHFGADVAVWGKSGSPLHVPAAGAIPELVIINVGAPEKQENPTYDASLVALEAGSGTEVWRSGTKQTSYASPQLVMLHGESVVLHLCDDLLMAHAVADGTVLFTYPWPGMSDNMPSCSQPISVGNNRLLLSKGYGHGASLIEVQRDADAWTAKPLWSPAVLPVLQTKYSNLVVRDGYAYGLNGDHLQCVEIESGKRVWRKRRKPSFGFGQILLTRQHLLIMSEAGEVIVADASPDQYREIAAFAALSADDVCWNNPVLIGDLLLVRNSVEAAAYRLPLATEEEESAMSEPTGKDVAAAGVSAESGA